MKNAKKLNEIMSQFPNGAQVYVNDGGDIRSVEFIECVNNTLLLDVKPSKVENRESVIVEEMEAILKTINGEDEVKVYIPENETVQSIKQVNVTLPTLESPFGTETEVHLEI